jgi:hypothetical protein
MEGEVPAGAYTLHLLGERQPYPSDQADLRMTLRGTGTSTRERLGPGPFHLEMPVDLARPLSHPVLEVSHPTWSPAEVGLSGDARTLSFRLRAAWLERR